VRRDTSKVEDREFIPDIEVDVCRLEADRMTIECRTP
jgi:hypothetical protein